LKFIVVVEMKKFANAVASISVTRKGGIHSMPKLEEV
jgi:sugar/nucleoside kinase (ribokinase family)